MFYTQITVHVHIYICVCMLYILSIDNQHHQQQRSSNKRARNMRFGYIHIQWTPRMRSAMWNNCFAGILSPCTGGMVCLCVFGCCWFICSGQRSTAVRPESCGHAANTTCHTRTVCVHPLHCRRFLFVHLRESDRLWCAYVCEYTHTEYITNVIYNRQQFVKKFSESHEICRY